MRQGQLSLGQLGFVRLKPGFGAQMRGECAIAQGNNQAVIKGIY